MASYRKKPLAGGKVSWEARINRKGLPVLSRSFATKKDAELWAAQIEGGAKPALAEKARAHTIAQAAEQWRENASAAELKASGRHMAVVEQDWGQFAIESVSHGRIQRWLTLLAAQEVPPPPNKKKAHPYYNGDRVRTYSASTRRKFYYALKKLLTWHSVRHDYSMPGNLFALQEIPAFWENPRDRRLEEGEEARVVAAAEKGLTNKDVWPRVIRLALETAMRDQELILMEWPDVNLKNRSIRLRAQITKTKTERVVPLSSRALAVLEAQLATKNKKDPRVFWQISTPAVASKAFRRIVVRAKVENLTLHDLRHEATSRFFENTTLSIPQIQSITGHETMSALQGYMHLRPHSLADALG